MKPRLPTPISRSWHRGSAERSSQIRQESLKLIQGPNNNVPRVIHLLTETEPFSEHSGGAISRWAANVLANDENAIVVAPSTDRSWQFPAGRVCCIPGLNRYRRLQEKTRNKLPWMFRMPMLRSILVEGMQGLQKGDIVWIHNRPEYASVLAPTVHAAGAKLVLHMHNSHLANSRRLAKTLEVDRFVFVSRFLQDEAHQRLDNLGNSAVLHNGASDKLFYPSGVPRNGTDGDPVILFASRIVPDKGAHILLDAMRRLHKRGVRAIAWIIGASGFGNNPISDYMKRLHQDAPPNVRFHDYCVGPALGERFRQADIFCLPSTWQDPFPLAVLEAMASALPTVTTVSGGIPEAFAEGGGILVSRGSASELAAAIEKLVLDAQLRRRLGQQAYDSFHRNFTWAAVHGNYQKIVASIP
jgi:spore coat protein SA